MAHKFYTGKPTVIPGSSIAAKAYNAARKQVDVEYLGDFTYGFNFPIDTVNSEVGKKLSTNGERCKFGFWKVTNRGEFIERGRPGERVVPSLGGKDYLVSYVVTPRMCSDDKVGQLSHPAFFAPGHEYQDIVDPGAVALATNGKGIVRDVASSLVDDCTADVKTTLKIGTSSPTLPGEIVFSGFGNANHCDTMTQVILKNSLPEIFAEFPGTIKPATFDPTLNADLFLRYDFTSDPAQTE